jgi:hypothetical protein
MPTRELPLQETIPQKLLLLPRSAKQEVYWYRLTALEEVFTEVPHHYRPCLASGSLSS